MKKYLKYEQAFYDERIKIGFDPLKDKNVQNKLKKKGFDLKREIIIGWGIPSNGKFVKGKYIIGYLICFFQQKYETKLP